MSEDIESVLKESHVFPPPAEFASVIHADIERWGRLARELGIQPQ